MRLRDMKKLFIALAAVALTACVKAPEKTVKVYAWQGEGGNTTEQTLQADFSKWHAHGVDGMCYNAGHDTEKIQRAAKAAHANGMEYHAWIPAMLQHGLDSTLYAVNRKGESAYSVQAYVPYYKCLCPNQEGTAEFLLDLYGKVADIPEVDYIHLDYIRYVDVILARGLWEKYGLVMDEEYPTADYCYCDKCVADFKGRYRYRHQIRRGSFQMRGMGAVSLRPDHEIGKSHRRRGSRQRQESERRRIPGAGLSR